MNKSPMNYLITIALGVVLWVIIAIFYGGSFSESLIYKNATPEDFLASFRVTMAIAVTVGIVNCLYWYYYGSRESVAGDLGKAKKVWRVSFIIQVVASIALLFTLIMIYISEGIATANWLIAFGLISILTWIFFWLCTFLMSPRTVKYVPFFK